MFPHNTVQLFLEQSEKKMYSLTPPRKLQNSVYHLFSFGWWLSLLLTESHFDIFKSWYIMLIFIKTFYFHW